MSTTNLEEAASIAAEFVSSLDNLPNEVQHLLAEIKHKDMRSQELQQEINKESAKYIRHSLRSTTNGTPGQALSPKDSAIPQLVKANYAEMDKLADERIALAERIVQLITRAQARLDNDIQKVLVLQGEDPTLQQGGSYYSSTPSRTPITQVVEHLRNASSSIAIAEAAPVSIPSGSIAAPPPRKKQRIAAAGSIKLPSPAPVAASTPTISANVVGGVGMSGSQRSRLSQQVHPRQSPSRVTRRVTASVGPDLDDAEGDEEPEDAAEDLGEVEEDKELYCFCQKLSYGEMIACDNPNCRHQWFHLPCINLKAPLPERWFCSECGGAAMERQRKGRKK